jgi:hypothetical protein
MLSFLDFFLAIFAAIVLKLGLFFIVKSYNSSLNIGVIDSFLQELCSWNLHEFENFSVFRTFFWVIFAAIVLKLGLLFCSEELQFQFEYRSD